MSVRRLARTYSLLSVLLCCILMVTPSASALQSGGNVLNTQKGISPMKEVPAKNLPNLDEVRRRGPAHPKALSPVPSKLKKCPPDEPNCNGRKRSGIEPIASDADNSNAADSPGARVLLGVMTAAGLNPYANVSLASAQWWLPGPPPEQSADARRAESPGWFSSLTGRLWAGFAPRRTPSGVFEYAGCDAVSGWAWDPLQPNTPIMVSLFSDGQLVGTILADQYRADLASSGTGDGRHGFRMTLPDSLRDGASHSLSVQVQVEGADITLGSSPKVKSCPAPTYEGAITSADCDQITGWAWDSGRQTTPIDVDIYVDGGFVARESADVYDAALSKGDNRHRFRLPTPSVARDGQPHAVTVRPAGATQSLGSPASVTCNGPSYQGFLDFADCNFIAGWVVDWNKLNTPVSVDIYSDGVFVTRAVADNFRQDIANLAHDNGRHGFIVQTPDSLRDGVAHYLTARPTGSTSQLTTVPGSITCSPRTGCSAAQSLPSTEFVKDFYLGSLSRQARPLELQYWNDALRTAATQGQTALRAKAKLLGRELLLQGEYAGRGRMAAGHESEYVSDLYWSYLQRGPDAEGQNGWAGNIQSQNSQGQNGWLNALTAFEQSTEFNARVDGICPTPADSVRSYAAGVDFSPLQNADGAWAYGYKATSGSAFALYPAHILTTSPPPSYDTWYQPSINDPFLTPLVRHVAGSQTLLLHPGPQGQQAVVRWTAPSAMSVVISGRFEAANTTTTDVHVRRNSSEALFDGNVNGSGSVVPFSLTRNVVPGETIEFVVGYGSNGTYYSDATTLDVTISQQSPAQTLPYNGTAAQVPNTIEAELFDVGGEGVAYHDTTSGTHGLDYNQPSPYPPTTFRSPTDVDMYKHTGYSNGYVVVMQAGEWMNYTVDVPESGSYTLAARTSYWSTTGGLFHIEVDGVDITGPLQHTAGSAFQTLTKTGVQLNAGRRVLRVVCDSNGSDGTYMGSLDYLRLTADEDAGMVARWRFDEGAGTTASDSTGNGSTGTLQGGASWSSGVIGAGSLNFNGTSGSVSVNASSSLSSASNNFSISFWANPRSTHQIDSESTTGVAGVSGQRYVFGPTASGNASESGAGVSVGTNGVSVYEHAGGYMPATLVYQGAVSGWTHVAVVYENRQPRLYLNGQLVRTGVTSPMATVKVIPWNLGGNSYGYFDGQVDDVRVYNRVLSTGEVEALTGAGGVDPTGNVFSEAKKDPANETGAGGDDPLSRNFNFSVPLVGLEGRAGLDLGLALNYNSLVWTRDATANAVKFDADYGDPSPGFRLALPVIQRRYRNARGENAYMLITPSGARVELRQSGASNTYESTDSSYTQLTEDSGLTLRPPDGSQLSFALKGYEFKCTRIKDRNGNFISLSYNPAGNISSITDTLGRVTTFTYDANGRPLTIEQSRNGLAHKWATFAYTSLTINASFASGVNVTGPANGTSISVLNRVSLDDGSFYNFFHNSWGQVYKVERRATDGSAAGRMLSYVEYDLATPTAAQTSNGTDCPRFTRRKDFVKDWNNDEPVYTSYSTAAGGVQVVKTNQIQSGSQVVDTADTVTNEITYGAANTWQRGLVTQVKTYWQSVLRRTAQTTWTQDDESLGYELNPRVEVSETSDPQGNHTGTSVEYTSFGLPTETYEWSGTPSNVLRRTHSEYNLDPAYVSRRVIGLVSSVSIYDEQGYLAAMMDYTYDQGGQFLQHQGEPVQHDGANYGVGFVSGRGLMTSVRRWDVSAPHDIAKSVESRVGYNTTGSAVFNRDPLGHQSSVTYADKFSDAGGTNTLAYPTSITDAGNYTSKAEYSFYTGQLTRTEDPKGAQQTYTYDAADRVLRIEASGRDATTNQLVGGGYTRWVYSDSMDAVQAWAQVDVGKPEVCSISVVDGSGRTRATASDFPGSAGGYRASVTTYDIRGRVYANSNPAEVNGAWGLAGDDAVAGEWKLNTQTYDWKGRPLTTTLPKLAKTTDPGYATEQPVTREVEYSGCACAGGEVITIKGEMVSTNEASPAQARRTQKFYGDALGRVVKSELYNWNGTTVYSSTTTKYNVLDRPLRVRAYQGPVPQTEPTGEGSGYQTTTLTYDGHGRILSKHLPRYDAGKSDVYHYNDDGTLKDVTDPRGVRTNYSYNSRHLMTGITYDTVANVNDTPDISFSYDEAGNRTLTSDGTGSTAYHYDALSRLDRETKTAVEPGNAAVNGHSFQIAYAYTLAGHLKSVTDPFGAQVEYAYDRAGQVTAVNGANFGNVASYASGITYRAWGAVKGMAYGDTLSLAVSYDSRMRVKRFDIPGLMSKEYSYNDDDRVRYMQDLSIANSKFDRAYSYDSAGRVTQALTGQEARGGTATDDRPYKANYTYDEWGNLIRRPNSRVWNRPFSFDSTVVQQHYTNDRNDAWQYNAEGDLVSDDDVQYGYDASGGAVSVTADDEVRTMNYDGDGRRWKTAESVTRYDEAGNATTTTTSASYELRSAVLGGQVLVKLDAQGQRQRGYVYLGQEVLAWQKQSGQTQSVVWEHTDASGASLRVTGQGGAAVTTESAELDPSGMNAGLKSPPPFFPNHPRREQEDMTHPGFADAIGSGATECRIDGVMAPCSMAMGMLQRGTGVELAAGERLGAPFGPKKSADADKGKPPTLQPQGERQAKPAGTATKQQVIIMNPSGMVTDIARFGYGSTEGWRFTQINLWELLPQQQQQRATRELRLIDETRTNLTALLKKKGADGKENPCATFFGGEANAIAALNAIPFTPGALSKVTTGIGMTIPTGTPVAAGTKYIVPISATVNTDGGFYNSFGLNPTTHASMTLPSFGGYGTNNNRSRALQMLHELGHVVVTGTNADGTPILRLKVDGNDAELSKTNTNTVLAHCKDLIEQIKN